MLETTVVHDQHNQIHAFETDLQSPTSTANRYKRGRAPAIGRAAGCYSAAMFAANNKATLDQVRNYQNALCIAQYFFRNTLIRGLHDRVQDVNGRLEAFDRVFTSGSGPGKRSKQAHKA